MALSDYVYESGSGVSFFIRLDDTQATLAGAVTGTPDIGAHVRVSSTRREFGVQPRFITAKRPASADPDAKILSTKVAVCTETAFNGLATGAAVTINGVGYTIASKTPEILR